MARCDSTFSGEAVHEPTLSLLVLESNDIDKTRDFYALLGLSFASEKHGSGPAHYSATLGSVVLELYPRKDGTSAAPVRIGFRVHALDSVIERLRERGAKILREPHDS